MLKKSYSTDYNKKGTTDLIISLFFLLVEVKNVVSDFLEHKTTTAEVFQFLLIHNLMAMLAQVFRDLRHLLVSFKLYIGI